MVELSHIQKKYGKNLILSDISFRLQQGEDAVLVGKNGCGKSTLLQVMAGALKADGGTIRYFGRCVSANRREAARYCGYVPQENPLLEELSVKDNLRLWGAGKRNFPERLLEEFGLADILSVAVEKLSGGMKRRLGIACALINDPPVLLLDEPTTALDLYYQESIRSWMEEYRKRQGIILMATHHMEEILAADRCLLMQNGKIRELAKEEISEEQIKEVITSCVRSEMDDSVRRTSKAHPRGDFAKKF